MSDKVGVIGLGSMGLGVAQSLMRAGFDVAGHDVSPDRQEQFVAAGGRTSSSPGHAATGARAVIIMVENAAQTDTVLFGEAGAAVAMQPESVIISCATMAPDDAQRFEQRAAELDIHYLDAPVSGGSNKARNGQLTAISSGSAEAYAVARPVLESFTTRIYELGETAGPGSAFKMVNQLLAGVHMAAACEAITFAARLGLDLDRVYEVIKASAGNSWMFEERVPRILAGDYTPRSPVDNFAKELGVVTALGQREKMPLVLATSALQMFVGAAAAGMGPNDAAAVALLLAKIAGVDLQGRDA